MKTSIITIIIGNEDNGETSFISFSFELSGLQFWGSLPISDFLQWENTFHQLIAEFPFKYE